MVGHPSFRAIKSQPISKFCHDKSSRVANVFFPASSLANHLGVVQKLGFSTEYILLELTISPTSRVSARLRPQSPRREVRLSRFVPYFTMLWRWPGLSALRTVPGHNRSWSACLYFSDCPTHRKHLCISVTFLPVLLLYSDTAWLLGLIYLARETHKPRGIEPST